MKPPARIASRVKTMTLTANLAKEMYRCQIYIDACQDCELGKASDAGQEDCTACAIGQNADLPALAKCKLCPAGSGMNNITGASDGSPCKGCTIGFYFFESDPDHQTNPGPLDPAAVAEWIPPDGMTEFDSCRSCASGQHLRRQLIGSMHGLSCRHRESL